MGLEFSGIVENSPTLLMDENILFNDITRFHLALSEWTGYYLIQLPLFSCRN